MDDVVQRIAFEIQDDHMSRLTAQRIVAAVLGALVSGDEIGRTLIVRSNGRYGTRDGERRYCSWD